MTYENMGATRSAAEGLLQEERALYQKLAKLDVRSPIAGTVLSARLKDKIGSYLREGDLVAEVGDTSQMRARVYIPEYELRYLHPGAEVHLRTGSEFLGLKGKVISISPAAEEAVAGVQLVGEYKGLRPPPYYVVDTLVPNPTGTLSAGMTGDAKIFSTRKSLLYFAWREIGEFVDRKVW
jgi:putative peptide zinc metalloprotease protein